MKKILLSLITTSIYASLGSLVANSEIPETACMAEFSKGEEVFHCSGAIVDENTFKTAAHCLKDDYKIVVKCKNGNNYEVNNIVGHKDFSHKKIKRDLYARAYDHALLELEGSESDAIQPLLKLEKEISKFISKKRECAFFGVGLNPWHEGTGKLHGVKTSSDKITMEDGLLIVNDPHSAVTMIGDSGASFFCRNDQGAWTNIGTVSAHSWDNETIVASNGYMAKDKNLVIEKANNYIQTNPSVNRVLESIEIGKTYRVLPFSSYTHGETQFNSVDRLHARFEVKDIQGEYAIGDIHHFGPAKYYLCFDGVSCDETLSNVKIKLADLVQEYQLPKFINL
jgi:hypothetical protein